LQDKSVAYQSPTVALVDSADEIPGRQGMPSTCNMFFCDTTCNTHMVTIKFTKHFVLNW